MTDKAILDALTSSSPDALRRIRQQPRGLSAAGEVSMGTGFPLSSAKFAELRFKRVADDWVFTAVNPWMVGRACSYLVNDAQKSAITDQLRRSRFIRRTIAFAALPLMLAAAVAYPWILLGHSIKANAVFCLCSILFCTAMTVIEHLCVGPLLQDAPRTTQKIRVVDKLRALSAAMTVRALSIFTAIFSSGAALDLYIATTEHDVALGLGAAYLVLLAIVCGGMLAAKLKWITS